MEVLSFPFMYSLFSFRIWYMNLTQVELNCKSNDPSSLFYFYYGKKNTEAKGKKDMPRKTTIVEAAKVENIQHKRNNECVRKPKLKSSTKISKRKVNRQLLNAIGPSIVRVRCKVPGEVNSNTVKKLLPYSEDTLLECLNAIMNKEMTQKYASEHYNIPKSTIYRRLQALKNRDEKVKNVLSCSEEKLKDILDAIIKKEMTRKYASEHYNISKTTIYKRLKDLKNPILPLILKEDGKNALNNPELPLIFKEDEKLSNLKVNLSKLIVDMPKTKNESKKELCCSSESETEIEEKVLSEKQIMEIVVGGGEQDFFINSAESPYKQGRRSEQKDICQAQQTKEIKITLNRRRSNQKHIEKRIIENSDHKKNENIWPNNKVGSKIEENKLIKSRVRNKKGMKPKQAAGMKSGINKEKTFQTKKTDKMILKSIHSHQLLTNKETPQEDNTRMVSKNRLLSDDTTGSKNTNIVDAHEYDIPKIAKDLNENIESLVPTVKMSNETRHSETLEIETCREKYNRASKRCNVVNTKLDNDQNAKVQFVQPVVNKHSIKGARGNQEAPDTLEYKQNIQPISVTIMEQNRIDLSVSPNPLTADNNGTDPLTPGMSWINDISSTSESFLTTSEKIVAIDGKVPFVGLTDCVTLKERDGDFLSSIGLKPISRSLESTSTSSISDHHTYRDVAFDDINTKQAQLSSPTSSSTCSSSYSTSSSDESEQRKPAELERCLQEEEKCQHRIKNIERLQNIMANFSSWMEQFGKTANSLVNETLEINDRVVNSFVSEIPLLCYCKLSLSTNKHNKSKKAIEHKTNLATSTSHTGIKNQSHIFSKPQNVQLKSKSISLNKPPPAVASLTSAQQQHTKVQKDCTNNNLGDSNKDAEDEVAEDDDDALSLFADSFILGESFSSFRDTKHESEKSNTPSTTSCHSNQTQNMDQINKMDFTRRLTRGSIDKSPISFGENFCDKVNVDFTSATEEVANCSEQNELFSPELNDSNRDIPSTFFVNNVNTQHDSTYYDRYILGLTQLTDKGKLFLGVCFRYQTGTCYTGQRCIYPHNLLTSTHILTRLSSYDTNRVIHEYICLRKNNELYLRFSYIFHNIFEERKCLLGIELLAHDSYSLYPNPHMLCKCVCLLSGNKFWQPSALLSIIVHDARAAPPPAAHQAHQPHIPHMSSARTFADVLLEVAVQDMKSSQRDHYSILFKLSAYLKNIHRKLETNTAVTLIELVTSQNVKDSNILQKVYHNAVFNSDIVLEKTSNQCLKKFCEMLSDTNLEHCHNKFDKSVHRNKNPIVTPVMDTAPRFLPPVCNQNAIKTKTIFSQYNSDYTNRSRTRTSHVSFAQKEWIDPWEKNNCSFQNSQPNTFSPNFSAAMNRQDAQRHTMLPHQNTNLFQNNSICQQSLVSDARPNNEHPLSPQDPRNQSELNIARTPFQPYPRTFGPRDRGKGRNKKFASGKFTNVDHRNVRRFGLDPQKRYLNNEFRQPSDFHKAKNKRIRYDV